MLADYRIFETDNFKDDLDRIARGGAQGIQRKLTGYVYPRLRAEPNFGPNIKRLKNWQPPTWRYRVGSWRFFYEIDEAERLVMMIAADHRSRAYR